MDNTYSPTWFELFMAPIEPARTEAEIAFLMRQLPQPAFSAVLDLCCGFGRHAHALANGGYRVTGVDRDATAVAEARRHAHGEPTVYLVHDMREVATVPGTFDAVVNLWQSFGYWDAATNSDVIRQIGQKVRPGGRLILDLYHRAFFEQHQGTRAFTQAGVPIVERRSMTGDRLTVVLEYEAEGNAETFAWQLYTPEEMETLAERHGFECVIAVADFDEHTSPSSSNPRTQIVLQRKG